MCGRFTLQTNLAQWVGSLFDEPVVDIPAAVSPRYNIAPTQKVWTISRNSKGKLCCIEMCWGLIPPWAKDASIGSKMINARSETVLEKISFKQPIQSQRCLILADGYYEWSTAEDHQKKAYWISIDDAEPFVFAAIWQQNKHLATTADMPLLSTSILTTAANVELEWLHHRSPVMLLSAIERQRWMNSESVDQAAIDNLCSAPDSEHLKIHQVDRKVGNVKNQGPELIEPIAS